MEIRKQELSELSTPELGVFYNYLKDGLKYYEDREVPETAEEILKLGTAKYRTQAMLNAVDDEIGNRLENYFIF